MHCTHFETIASLNLDAPLPYSILSCFCFPSCVAQAINPRTAVRKASYLAHSDMKLNIQHTTQHYVKKFVTYGWDDLKILHSNSRSKVVKHSGADRPLDFFEGGGGGSESATLQLKTHFGSC